MADTEVGERLGGRLGRTIDILDHPLLFAFAMTLIVFAMANLIYFFAIWLGVPGIAQLFR